MGGFTVCCGWWVWSLFCIVGDAGSFVVLGGCLTVVCFGFRFWFGFVIV